MRWYVLLLALVLFGCGDDEFSTALDDESPSHSQEEPVSNGEDEQEQRDDRAQRAFNDSVDNLGGANVSYP